VNKVCFRSLGRLGLELRSVGKFTASLSYPMDDPDSYAEEHQANYKSVYCYKHSRYITFVIICFVTVNLYPLAHHFSVEL